MASTQVLSDAELSPPDVRAYTNALAWAIAQAGGPETGRMAALYRVFAWLGAPPEIRREALWRTYDVNRKLPVVDLPAATEARTGLAADLLRLAAPNSEAPLTD